MKCFDCGQEGDGLFATCPYCNTKYSLASSLDWIIRKYGESILSDPKALKACVVDLCRDVEYEPVVFDGLLNLGFARRVAELSKNSNFSDALITYCETLSATYNIDKIYYIADAFYLAIMGERIERPDLSFDLVSSQNSIESVPLNQAKTNNNTVINTANPLLNRVALFLEDGDFDKVNEYCELVLDQEPNNSIAYLYNLLADTQCKQIEDLRELDSSFENNSNYLKFMRFGDNDLKSLVSQYLYMVHERIENKKEESDRLIIAAFRVVFERHFGNPSEIISRESGEIVDLNQRLSTINQDIGNISLQALSQDKETLLKRIEVLEKELSSLSIFKGNRKKQITSEVKEAKSEIENLQKKMMKAQERTEIEQIIKKKNARIRAVQNAEKHYFINKPFPNMPYDEAVKRILSLSEEERKEKHFASKFVFYMGKWKNKPISWNLLAKEGSGLVKKCAVGKHPKSES